MGLYLEQIEKGKFRRKCSHKWMKNQRNRKIRRVDVLEIPNLKYKFWEF